MQKKRVEREYQTLETLGQGASGSVYKVKKKSTGAVFAMKVMKKGGDEDMNDAESLENEIRCMKRLRHRHIVNLETHFENASKTWLIMDCADGGMLYDRILALDHFSEKSASHLIKQVLKAIHYMHQNGVVHRDLKPENILLETPDPDSNIKVADLGLAVDLHFDEAHQRDSINMKSSTEIKGGFCGSPIAMAPEVAIKNAAYGPQCDIWSLGCMTYELLSGKPPFIAKSAKALFKVIRDADGPKFDGPAWKSISQEAKELVRDMLRKRPEDRPSAMQCLGYAWFKNAKDDHLEELHQSVKSRYSQESPQGSQDANNFKKTSV
jgi:serine/threonine protein kinase